MSPLVKATLYTDASLQTRSKSGGWGMWAASDMGRIVRGGVIAPKFCSDSTHGELAAVFAGLYVVFKEWQGLTQVMVRSDNSTVAKLLGPSRSTLPCVKSHPEIAELLTKIDGVCGTTKIIPVWVKGHQVVSSRPSFVNNACDRLARKYRIEAENESQNRLDGSGSRG